MELKLLAPLILVLIIYVLFCIRDIIKAQTTRYLPKWTWILICLVSIPLGGILYFIIGKEK